MPDLNARLLLLLFAVSGCSSSQSASRIGGEYEPAVTAARCKGLQSPTECEAKGCTWWKLDMTCRHHEEDTTSPGCKPHATASRGAVCHPDNEAASSTWDWLERRFVDAALKNEDFFHCFDPTCTGYCRYQDEMPPLSLKHLALPRNARILEYGHSYLGEVFANLVIAGADGLTEVEDIEFNGKFLAKTGPCKVKPPNEPWNESITYTPRPVAGRAKSWTAPPLPSLQVKTQMVRFTFGKLNTTLISIINKPVAQNPHCLAQMERFLKKFGHFDIIAFMVPHGGSFNVYTTQKSAGVNVGDWKPVDLTTMKAEGKQSKRSELALLFRPHGDFLVFVEPWTGMTETRHQYSETKEVEAEHLNLVRNDVDAMMDGNEYVFALRGSDTPWEGGSCAKYYINPTRGPCRKPYDGIGGHQCQPGAITIMAKDLNAMMHRQLHHRV